MLSLCYRNPRLLIMAVGLIVVSGLSAFHVLPRAEDPVLTMRSALILTRMPGAPAERVEALVTERIEKKLAEIDEIWHLESTSRRGISLVTVELLEEIPARRIDSVWSRVRDKLGDVVPQLPEGATTPEFEEGEITAYTMIAAVTWQADGPVQYAILRRTAESLEDRLRVVPGTADVELFGDPEEEIRVELETQRLAALGLSPTALTGIIARSDAKVAAGQVFNDDSNLLIEVSGEFDSVGQIRQLPVRVNAAGQVVRLGDLARVEKTIAEPPTEWSLVGNRPAVVVAVRMEAGRRVDHWAEKVRGRIAAFDEALPTGLGLDVIFDQSQYVERRLESLLGNLLLGIALVVAVSFAMMGWRSAMIITCTLPLASLMTLALMNLLGMPIHQMSITGLIIALGLLIDNAIVIVDAVRARRHAGASARESIEQSVRHLVVPLASSTLTTVLAFMPIVLAPGGAGEFIGPLGLSVCLALVSSFVLSMTVVPALTAMVDRSTATVGRWWERGVGAIWLRELYGRALDRVLAQPLLGIGVATALPVIGFMAFPSLPMQFFPPADRDQFRVEVRMPEITSVDGTRRMVERINEHVERHPHVVAAEWFVGNSAPKFYYNLIEGEDGAAFFAQALVQLDTIESGPVIDSLQRALDQAFPEAQILCRQLEQGPPFNAPIELRLFGANFDILREEGNRLRRILAATPRITHTRATTDDGMPKLRLDVDEQQARRAGFTNVEVARQLESQLRGLIGGSLLESTEQLPVRVRLTSDARADLGGVLSLNLMQPGNEPASAAGVSEGGRYTPVAGLARARLMPELASITRRDHERVNVIQGFLEADVLPATVLADFKQRLAESDVHLPAGVRLEYGGEEDRRSDSIGHLMASVGVLLTLMVAALVLSFRSFRLAALIGAVGALSIGLGMFGLWAFGYPFGFVSIVGTMGLVGVAINDAIVVLAGIREDPRARVGDVIAIRNVVIHETRHVLATTLTTMVGFLPLWLDGGMFWPPLAVVIAGGIFGATLLALCLVPTIYHVMHPMPATGFEPDDLTGMTSQQVPVPVR